MPSEREHESVSENTAVAADDVAPTTARLDIAPPISCPAGMSGTGSALLQRLRAAPVRVRCFGARSVWHGDRQLEIADTELLLLLAAHPISGIKNESVSDMLWEEEPSDPSAALRKRRYRLRDELRRAVAELSGDPFPGE